MAEDPRILNPQSDGNLCGVAIGALQDSKRAEIVILACQRTFAKVLSRSCVMARSYFQIAIQHSGLNKHRIIRGADRYLVEAAAATQQRAWAEQYARKVAVDERRQEREDKRLEMEWNQDEAEERTADAQAARNELRGLLAATLSVDDRVDWAAMMRPPFSQPRPKERPFVALVAGAGI